MEDGCNLDQFMQADSYVRFDPERSARSTYLFRAYNKWCADNLGKAVDAKEVQPVSFQERGPVWYPLFQAHRGRLPGYRGVYVRP